MQLNDIDMKKRKLLLRDFQNGLTRLQAKENIVKEFGDCIGYGERTCDRWFIKFRSGDFDLTQKPRDKTKRKSDYTRKKYRRATKTVKVSEVKFKQQELPATMNVEKNETLQNLMKSKPELTISKVNGAAGLKKPRIESNIITKRLIASPKRPVPFQKETSSKDSKGTNAVPLEMPKLRPRRPRSKGIEIQLPANTAKRMNSQTLIENHSIGDGIKALNRKETAKNTVTESPKSKEVTVQFQNIIPEVAKNTVRKKTKAVEKRCSTKPQQKPQNSMLKIANVAHVESMSPEKNKITDQSIAEVLPSKREVLPQVSPLTNQKGIIYLNPQEIFRQSFGGFENSLKRPNPFAKPPFQIQKSFIQPDPDLPSPSPERKDSVIQCDSDESGEDILFPENVRLPAPKIKTDPTYTTYWDMERGEPIHLNAVEPISLKSAIPVIEID